MRTTVSEGVLSGYYKCPDKCDEVHDMLIIGHPINLTQVLQHMGFNPDEVETQDDGTIVIRDDRGSYLTMRPAQRATDVLAGMIANQL